MHFPGTKLIYFIRHGQSANNEANLKQGAAGKLSEKGEKQARFVGERFINIPIDTILTSPYERTQQTASIITEVIRRPIEYSDLLVERKNPSEVIGKDADSEEVKSIMNVIDRSFHDSNFRYSDEENFEDLKVRAKKLLDYLASRKEDHIMCISHRIFLKMVISYIERGEALDSHEFVKLDFFNTVNNTAVAVCIYTPWKKLFGKNPWKVLAFNDYGRIIDEDIK